MSYKMKLLREAIIVLLNEVKNKPLWHELLEKYPNIPRYVLHDMYKGTDESYFSELNNLNWKKKIIEVNPSDFFPETLRRMKEREFGKVNPYLVPNDEERMKQQEKLAKERPQGDNEPIIVVKMPDGYELWEGWHRTMSLLKMGDNGGQPETWEKIKINAWIGYPS